MWQKANRISKNMAFALRLGLVRGLSSSALALLVLYSQYLALAWRGYYYRLALAVVKSFLKIVQRLQKWEKLSVTKTNEPQSHRRLK